MLNRHNGQMITNISKIRYLPSEKKNGKNKILFTQGRSVLRLVKTQAVLMRKILEFINDVCHNNLPFNWKNLNALLPNNTIFKVWFSNLVRSFLRKYFFLNSVNALSLYCCYLPFESKRSCPLLWTLLILYCWIHLS